MLRCLAQSVADAPDADERLLNRSDGVGQARERPIDEPEVRERDQHRPDTDLAAQDQQIRRTTPREVPTTVIVPTTEEKIASRALRPTRARIASFAAPEKRCPS